jgi:hypothetical protein
VQGSPRRGRVRHGDDGTVIAALPHDDLTPEQKRRMIERHERSKALAAKAIEPTRRAHIEKLQAARVKAARRRDADAVKLTTGMLRMRRRQHDAEARLRRWYDADTLRLLRPRSAPAERRPGCSRPRSRRTRTARATRAGPDSEGDPEPPGVTPQAGRHTAEAAA